MQTSVGRGGVNQREDVIEVQLALNGHIGKLRGTPLKPDGRAGPKTIEAIARFQGSIGMPRPDGLIQPGGKTAQALKLTSAPQKTAPGGAANLSGSAWWHANQKKWPNEKSLAALSEPWGTKARKFIAALEKAGARVQVNATTRSMTRAKLMRYSWDVSKGLIAPKDVPAIPGVDIRWDHGDVAKSKKAAAEMVALFAIKFQPSLDSNHLRGTAVDMTIAWSGDLTIVQGDGKSVTIKTTPRDGTNAQLHKVGETYGVLHKLPKDPPHWSNTGR